MNAQPSLARIRTADTVARFGRVRQILPTHIEADGPDVPLGSLCSVETRLGAIHTEVVRVDRDGVVLSPFEHGAAISSGARVRALGDARDIVVGSAFLGRAVDPMGHPIDGLPPVRSSATVSLTGYETTPLERVSALEVFETGIRAIDGLLTLGRGQRIGVFAASGVGKTSLMKQIARQAKADITIICLIGERGREVEEIWNHAMDGRSRQRATLIAATSDQTGAMRARASQYALAHAEYWRAQGKHVLLVLDSVTRLAMAMREMGLAAGEPPTVRAYTPSVFAAIPKLVERCGALRGQGAITAIMTVLSETDDVDDPMCELMKSLLDGHLVLSRGLAEQGHFPALDVLRSVSRRAESLMEERQRSHARNILGWLSLQETTRTLVDTGLYVKGTNQAIDEALAFHPEIVRFLRQGCDERENLASTLAKLAQVGRAA